MEANHQGPLTPPRSVEEKPITVEDSEKESVVIKDVKLGGIQAVALEEESRVADIPGLVTSQFYSVDFSQSRIGVKKCVFNKRTINDSFSYF